LQKSEDIFPADNIPHLIGLLFEYANDGVLVNENRRRDVLAIVMLLLVEDAAAYYHRENSNTRNSTKKTKKLKRKFGYQTEIPKIPQTKCTRDKIIWDKQFYLYTQHQSISVPIW